MKFLVSSALVVAFVLGGSYTARAQGEITLLAPGGIKTAIDQLIPGFESKTGTQVKVTYAAPASIKQTVAKGEGLDVSIMLAPFPDTDALVSDKIAPSSATAVAHILLGVGVQKGIAKPDISTPESVKRMLLAAKSISYPDPASGSAAGISSEEAIRKLGLTEQLEPKVKRAPGGAAMALVAKGEVDLYLGFISEMNDPGLDVVGPLPPGASTPVDVAGFVSVRAKDSAAAKALLDYLSSPEAAPIYKAAKIQPAH